MTAIMSMSLWSPMKLIDPSSRVKIRDYKERSKSVRLTYLAIKGYHHQEEIPILISTRETPEGLNAVPWERVFEDICISLAHVDIKHDTTTDLTKFFLPVFLLQPGSTNRIHLFFQIRRKRCIELFGGWCYSCPNTRGLDFVEDEYSDE